VYAGGGQIASASIFELDGRPVRGSPNLPRLWTNRCTGTKHFRDAEISDLPVLGEAAWVDTQLKESFLSQALLEASGKGDTAGVRRLIAAGHDVNGRDRRHGTTALKAAAGAGHADTVRALLAARADIDVRKSRQTALDDAVLAGHAEVVRILLGAGARAGPLALAAAASRGHSAVLEVLLAAGMSARGAPGAEALVAAAEQSHIGMVRRLLDEGADPVRPPAQRSAPDVAAAKGNLAMIRLLLDKGARPSRTTLDAAVQSGNREAVRLVDEPLRRLVGPVRPGPTALIKATAESNVAGIDLALESGVEVDRDRRLRTDGPSSRAGRRHAGVGPQAPEGRSGPEPCGLRRHPASHASGDHGPRPRRSRAVVCLNQCDQMLATTHWGGRSRKRYWATER
jgi:ankyrin repeat protein